MTHPDGFFLNVTGYRYIAHLYCLAVQAGFYSDAVECWIFVRRVAGSILGRVRTEYIFLHLLHLAPNVNNSNVHKTSLSFISSDSRTPRNSRTNFNVEGENVTVYRYIHVAHLNCIAVQARFYSDSGECWNFVRRVAGAILGRVRTEAIFLHLLHEKF